ncbi:hypothetical protein FRC09_000927 [Ceratobasidium sp. 395]|nr:hypothetical protein FRC09_000927 [Ceratobasidium sp. 395]
MSGTQPLQDETGGLHHVSIFNQGEVSLLDRRAHATGNHGRPNNRGQPHRLAGSKLSTDTNRTLEHLSAPTQETKHKRHTQLPAELTPICRSHGDPGLSRKVQGKYDGRICGTHKD